MKLCDLFAKLTGIESRLDASAKSEVGELKTLVSGEMTARENELTKARADLVTSQASITDLTGKNTELLTKNAKLESDSANLAAFNTELTTACINGGLLVLNGPDGKPLAEDATPEAKATAAAGISTGDKFKAYQGGVTKAFAKVNLPNTLLPVQPSKAPNQGNAANTMKRAEYFALKPADQLAFIKADGKITD